LVAGSRDALAGFNIHFPLCRWLAWLPLTGRLSPGAGRRRLKQPAHLADNEGWHLPLTCIFIQFLWGLQAVSKNSIKTTT
jgi:hypothetical protein